LELRCEICGAKIVGKGFKVVIDGANLIVCSRCAMKNPSKIVGYVDLSAPLPRIKRSLSRPLKVARKPRYRRQIVEEIVEDYAERIKVARERMGLTRELLATMVGEKVSTIRRIEAGTLEPTVTLAKKLEKVLKIKLVEVYEEEEISSRKSYSEEFEPTLGDLVEFKD